MAQQQAFCVHCGQPLNPGASFCGSCGATVGQTTVEANTPTGFYPYAGTAAGPMTAMAQPQPRRRPNFLLIVVGFALVLIGLIQPAARLFGEATTASIVETEQKIDSSSDKMDYNYQITYAFSVDGKRYTGSYQMNKVYNIANLPDMGSWLDIKYLAFMPYINTPVNMGNPFLVLLIAGGLGILLIVLGIKGRPVVRR